MKKILKLIFLLHSIMFLYTYTYAQNVDVTDYEISGYKETPYYEKMLTYALNLSVVSDELVVTSIGLSPEGRIIPMMIYDKDKAFEPQPDKQKVVLLVQACIHAGETEGKDAGLMLLRDIVVKKMYQEYLDDIVILFIPIFNVDGHERFGPYNRINQNGPKEAGWRTTASNLNLNRDFLKADAPEMQNFLRMFHYWNPSFFIDIHTTNGADYQYALTYDLNLGGNMEENLTAWTRDKYLEPIKLKMEADGFPIFPYVIFRNWYNPKSGLVSWVSPPILSGGYGAAVNCPSLLIETHMLKEYKVRVDATYFMLLNTIKILHNEREDLLRTKMEAEMLTQTEFYSNKEFPLSYKQSPDSVMVDFKGISYITKKSEISGEDIYVYTGEKEDMKLPHFNNQMPDKTAVLPNMYIIPAGWTEVINRMKLHGIEYTITKERKTYKLHTTRFSDVVFADKPNEGRQRIVSFSKQETEEMVEVPKGSMLIFSSQPKLRLLAHALEAESPSSFLMWGFFNSIFEQKEYAEMYVIEDIAIAMLANDKKIEKQFNAWKNENPDKPKTSREIANWFYQKTPYWDSRKDLYPIFKIYDSSQSHRIVLEHQIFEKSPVEDF